MKIILSMISGPEGGTLARCVRSFAPYIDGVAVVFAPGARDCTETRQILLDTCQSIGLRCAVADYANAPDHADWPHVDDYAAARNASLALACGEFAPDWLMWADADDVLPPASGDALRDIIRQSDKYQSIWSPYVLGADNRFSKRERLFRPGHQWTGRVHEYVQCDPDHTVWAEQLKIAHAPAIDKTGSHDRNLRILLSIPEAERSGHAWFYIHEEASAQGLTAIAMQSGIEATGRDDVQPWEKYNIYMRLGSWMRDHEAAERSIMESIRIDPTRRDAFVAMAKLNMTDHPARSLAFLRAMSGIPRNTADAPASSGWQPRDMEMIARTRMGEDVSCLRAAAFRDRGRKLTVIHPTCRPEQAILRREEWLNKAEDPEAIEYIFGVSESDPEVVTALSGYHCALAGTVPPGHSTSVVNHNAAAAAASGRIVIVAQDDVHPCEGWDMMVRRALQPHIKSPRVLHIHDGHREDQIMIIMCVTRPWLHAHGNTLLCPEYDGYWSDTEFSLRAYAAGQVIDGRHIRFFHNHPIFTGAPSDESYMRQQNPEAYERGRAIFAKRNPGLVPCAEMSHARKPEEKP